MKWLTLLGLLLVLPSLAAERVVSIGGDVTQIIYALDGLACALAITSVGLSARIPSALSWRM
jgi:iron complex transport system substrate-binding protein